MGHNESLSYIVRKIISQQHREKQVEIAKYLVLSSKTIKENR